MFSATFCTKIGVIRIEKKIAEVIDDTSRHSESSVNREKIDELRKEEGGGR